MSSLFSVLDIEVETVMSMLAVTVTNEVMEIVNSDVKI